MIPIASTIIFDLFPPEKRGKMVGIFGAVFGITTVSGPLLGAYHTGSIASIFLWALIPAVFTVVFAFLMSSERPGLFVWDKLLPRK